jgi:hypothetical protein
MTDILTDLNENTKQVLTMKKEKAAKREKPVETVKAPEPVKATEPVKEETPKPAAAAPVSIPVFQNPFNTNKGRTRW